MTDVAFPALSEAEQVFYDLVWEPMVKAGEIWLETDAPFFSLPIIKQAEEEIIQLVADWVFRKIILFMDLAAVRFKNADLQVAYDKAFVALKIIAIDKGLDSPEYKKAKEDAKAALSQIARFGATRS